MIVLVDDSRVATRAVRRAAALAGAIHAALIAAVVDTPSSERLPFDKSRDLQEAIDDAVDLGAELVRIQASDVLTGIERIARAHGATHVFIAHREVGGVRRLVERPLADRLVERIPDLEVHVVGAQSTHEHEGSSLM